METTITFSKPPYSLKAEEIIYLEASSNYTKLFLIDGRIIVSAKTLKTYENQLSQNIFLRIHRSFLINMQHVCDVRFLANIGLTKNFYVKISRRKRAHVKKRLRVN